MLLSGVLLRFRGKRAAGRASVRNSRGGGTDLGVELWRVPRARREFAGTHRVVRQRRLAVIAAVPRHLPRPRDAGAPPRGRLSSSSFVFVSFRFERTSIKCPTVQKFGMSTQLFMFSKVQTLGMSILSKKKKRGNSFFQLAIREQEQPLLILYRHSKEHRHHGCSYPIPHLHRPARGLPRAAGAQACVRGHQGWPQARR